MNEPIPKTPGGIRLHTSAIMAGIGMVIAALGAEPGLFGLDRSPVTGFVQLTVFLVGLGLITIAGCLCLNGLWNCSEKSIVYDIGLRLVATGYVIAVAGGMADVFGFGGQEMIVMRFGAWQKLGVISGEVVIAIGFLMMLPLQPKNKKDADDSCNDEAL